MDRRDNSKAGAAADLPDDILHPTSRSFFRHWEAVRGERPMPARPDIDLAALAPILPWLCILERDPRRRVYTWRLAGTGVCRLWGKELTGREMLAGWDGFERETMTRLLDSVSATHQPCAARFRARSFGGEELGIEMMAVPVLACRPAGDEVQVLAALAPFRDPHWLGRDPLVSFQLARVRVLWTSAMPEADAAMFRLPALAGAAGPAARLRVIDGGRT